MRNRFLQTFLFNVALLILLLISYYFSSSYLFSYSCFNFQFEKTSIDIATDRGDIVLTDLLTSTLVSDWRSKHASSWDFSFKSYASFETKFAKIGPSVARSRDVLYSHVGTKFAQNSHFAYVCVQNTWKLLVLLKCTNTVFILSLGPFA